MIEATETSPHARESLSLKLPEPVVSSVQPWDDDLLDRRQVATTLTNLVRNQSAPLTISIHGSWGTGKTFLLKRWQKDIERQKFNAIYFNAWEDDFCDDPLLAILGQLSEYFKDSNLKTIAHEAFRVAVPLIRQNVLGVLNNFTGLTLELDKKEQSEKNLLDQYLSQRATKDELKRCLTKVSKAVVEETGHPLVFIVDELDRCRPTFAIELLERVKHIFDVPNLVFIFGVNRDELSKSLSSVYGDINTYVYLRRFFDFDFNLLDSDSQGFIEHLMDKFQIRQVFEDLSNEAGTTNHINDYDNYRRYIPKLWSALSLSLRDIDYGIRLLALLARNVPLRVYTHPFLLAILIAVKFKRPEFYRSLVTGDFQTSEIMDYINEELRPSMIDEELSRYLDRSEGFLYCADNHNRASQPSGEIALATLGHVPDGSSVTSDHRVLSERAQNADQQQRDRICQAILDGRQLRIDGKIFGHLATLIDTYQRQMRL